MFLFQPTHLVYRSPNQIKTVVFSGRDYGMKESISDGVKNTIKRKTVVVRSLSNCDGVCFLI